MKILNRLTIKNLTLNKKRTITIIIGIILSSFLITAVSTIASSYNKTMIEEAKINNGDYHYEYLDIPVEEIQNIKNNKNIEYLFLSQDIGYTKLEKEETYKPYGYVMAFSEETIEKLNVNIKEGRLPEKENEIVIQGKMISNEDVDWKIGDTITIDIGKRQIDGRELNQDSQYIRQENSDDDDEVIEKIEEIVEKETYTYTIVGIIDQLNYKIEPIMAPGYTMITYLDTTNVKPENTLNVYVRYKDLNNTNAILKYKCNINKEVIQLETFSLENMENRILSILVLVIFIIVITTSVYCIRNSFEISISERIKQYGMLLSLGATKKQIKHSVYYESFILGIIAIPIGIFLGIFSIYFLLNITQNIYGDILENSHLIFNVNIGAIFIAILINVLTIYLLARKSARKASKISPIEAIRSNNDIKIETKKIKIPKKIKKIFGIGGVLAYKNLKRNKKKYRTTVISLIISVTVFITISSFTEYALKSSENINDYNITVEAKQEILEDIAKNQLVDKYTIIKKSGMTIEIGEDSTSITLVAIGEQAYMNFINELNLDYQEVKDKLIYLNFNSLEAIGFEGTEEEKELILSGISKYSKGEIIEGKINEEEVSLEVAFSTATKRPMSMSSIDFDKAIVSEEFWKKYNLEDLNKVIMYIDAKDADELETYINKNYSSTEVSVENSEVRVRQQKRMWIEISIFIYGIIIAISLIGITNVFNTINMNMQLRQKEFANLKSIGMTKKEFNKMLMLESIFYSLKSLLISIPLGIIGSSLSYKLFNSNENIAYIFPIKGIVIAILAVVILVYAIMRVSIRKSNKQNIIETIRRDNI